MRIQNITGSIVNRWVLFTIAVWVIVVAVASFTLLFFLKTERLKSEAQILVTEINQLAEKQKVITNNAEKLDLEDKHLSEILSDVVAASKKSDVRLGETTVAEAVVDDEYPRLPVSIVVAGTYNQIGVFVSTIEQSLRFTIVDLDMSTKDSKTTGIRCILKAEYIIL